ncbi:MAG: diadenylate cyclase CdaA [Chloroflexota bacterium]|nr:diadenylate cyclase CdaA [Chloroflexota bacterium]MDE2899111.1 diadenylate cyclase CdaA [Chloroflexota bacterium]
MEQLEYLAGEFDFGAAIQILLVALLFNAVLSLIRGTQADQLLRGLLVVAVGLFVIGRVLQLELVNWILDQGLLVATFALIVVFQPELRRLLERVGRTGTLVAHPFGIVTTEQTQQMIDAVVGSAEELSARLWGALIVVQRQGGLDEFASTGTRLEASLSRNLLVTVFHPGSELHDGAILLNGMEVVAAHVMLPLSDELGPQDHVGTRHRAGLGITEATDAIAVIISEETGGISMAVDGRLERHLTPDQLRRRLETALRVQTRGAGLQGLPAWISRSR